MRASRIFLLASSCLSLVSGQETSHGDEESKEMGPVAFMWPPDREWGAAQDNTAPCGSSEGVTERTEFPLRKHPIFQHSIVIRHLTVNLSCSQGSDCTHNPR